MDPAPIQAVCRPLCYQERILSRSLGSILLSYTLPVLFCSVVFNIPRLIRFSPLYNYLGEDPTFLQVSSAPPAATQSAC